jgi:hypothetical protein
VRTLTPEEHAKIDEKHFRRAATENKSVIFASSTFADPAKKPYSFISNLTIS